MRDCFKIYRNCDSGSVCLLTDSVKFVRILKIARQVYRCFWETFYCRFISERPTVVITLKPRNTCNASALNCAASNVLLCSCSATQINSPSSVCTNSCSAGPWKKNLHAVMAFPFSCWPRGAGVIRREGLTHAQRKFLVEALATLFYCTLRSVLAFLRRFRRFCGDFGPIMLTVEA